MTRKEEIRQAAEQYAWVGDLYDLQAAFTAGAEWADKTMLEKFEKRLKNLLEKTIQKPSINDGYTSDTIDLVEFKRRRLIEEVLYDFKKAMEL